MTDGALAHLLPAARKQAELEKDERILGLLRDRWIDYPRATQALQQLERLYETPRRDRMPCLLLHGDSNIGKTKITAKFRRAHPNEFDERSGVERCPVVAMQMPPTPDQHRFYSGLLFELGAPHNAAAGLASLERLAREILKRVSPRMLVVDEVHHLLAGTYREQRASLNLLKFLANDLQISMVLVGTRDAVLALQTDTQMISRYNAIRNSTVAGERWFAAASRGVRTHAATAQTVGSGATRDRSICSERDRRIDRRDIHVTKQRRRTVDSQRRRIHRHDASRACWSSRTVGSSHGRLPIGPFTRKPLVAG